jgi:hypothetical protein
MCRWPLPAQSFSGPSPLGLATVFYCLRFETSLFVASYDSQGHGGGIRPRLHTGSRDGRLPQTLSPGSSSCLQDNPSARTTEKTHLPHIVAKECFLIDCPATAINIRSIVERAHARRCLSCRCLAIHITQC